MKKCYVREKSESYIMRFEKTALEIFQNLSLLAANVMTDSFLQLVLQELPPSLFRLQFRIAWLCPSQTIQRAKIEVHDL